MNCLCAVSIKEFDSLTKLRAAGYDKPFKTVAQGVADYMVWLNRNA